MESSQHMVEQGAENSTKQHEKCANNTTTTTTTSKDLLYVNPHKVNKNLLINNNNNNNNKARRTYKVDSSSILDRVKNFIPEIACANEHLSKISAEEKENLNIENVDDDDTNVIEMNINMVDPDLLLSDDDEDDSDSSSDEEEGTTGVVCNPTKKTSSNVVIEE